MIPEAGWNCKDGAVRRESIPCGGRGKGKDAGAERSIGHIEQSTGCSFVLRVDGQVRRWLGWVAEGFECQAKKFGVYKSLVVS